ncbi:putative phosphoribosyl transferase [Blastococcus aggregatus]|uniref:Putative phosphoribosyl transferase n=1 Tax=Blastococcus aggregatus TaxID=38502 RepID=A0A285V939_9ACTN|nr:phosphoribosyltransferase family protein [Blastococcus aggregatus]SOC49566.1 putative phosphoribosyl transferase [Blastococcus aggregatus]
MSTGAGTARAIFPDRTEAGRQLAARLAHLRGQDAVVLGLPRGGVPVAVEVARRLDLPLDVIVVRKLGLPGRSELAMGAVGEDGVVVLNHEVLARSGVGRREVAVAEQRERREVELRASRFRAHRLRVPLRGRTAVIVDDGIATGATARAACQVARAQGASRVVLAAPACAPSTADVLRGEVDELVVVTTPADFVAVGQAYDDFRPVPDEQVLTLLEEAATVDPRPPAGDDPGRDEEVEVVAGNVRLGGRLTVPAHPLGIVVFVHGSGSSRHSPRNGAVARVLQEAGLATLLFDLLTPGEEQDRRNVFDVPLLAGRLSQVTAWLRRRPGCAPLPMGWFGASTGAAAALWAAAEPGADVAAVVSRGGRPDLAGPRLEDVRAPTLLLVGGRDDVVLELNVRAAARLRCEHRLEIVPGATHLFEEPGTLEAAAHLARDWFVSHFPRAPRSAA